MKMEADENLPNNVALLCSNTLNPACVNFLLSQGLLLPDYFAFSVQEGTSSCNCTCKLGHRALVNVRSSVEEDLLRHLRGDDRVFG